MAAQRLLSKLSTDAKGQSLQLVKLLGADVPSGLEVYFCKRTFSCLEVRPKNRVRVEGLAYDYSLAPNDIDSGTSGEYELKCRRTGHHLQVKVKPTLGLAVLLPRPRGSSQEFDALLQHKLYALAGLHHLLLAFLRDPSLEKVVACKVRGTTRHIDKLLDDEYVAPLFMEKCHMVVFSNESDPPAFHFIEHILPENREVVFKAAMEVKMLLIAAVGIVRKMEGMLSPKQVQDFHKFMSDISEDSCLGGVDAQHASLEESRQSLTVLVCGSGNSAATEDAWQLLQELTTRCSQTIIPRIRQYGRGFELQVPPMDFSTEAGGVDFKQAYNRIWATAVDSYLYNLVHSPEYNGGSEAGIAGIRKQWTRPDEALRRLCPSAALEEAIQAWREELDRTLTDLDNRRRGVAAPLQQGGVSRCLVNPNPRSASGLQNLGENLCAANALLQLLFSVEPWRNAVIGSQAQEAPSSEAQRLVAGMRSVFLAMSNPRCAVASAREVALVLHGGKLGEQQDCDELLHRLSSQLQESLDQQKLQASFRQHFVGTTYEVQVREALPSEPAADGGAEFEFVVRASKSGGGPNGGPVIGYPLRADAARKEFLSIPVQQNNQTVMEALQDFTSWLPTGGSEVSWTQEQIRSLPGHLCLSSRQVAALEWEETLNLSRFLVHATPAMHCDRYERAKALQLSSELKDALEHITPAIENLECAELLLGHGEANGQGLGGPSKAAAKSLADLADRLQARQQELERRLAELDELVGEGFKEPSLVEFLDGVVEKETMDAVFRDQLGVQSVRQLAELLSDGEGAASPKLEGLVQSLTLTQESVDALVARFRARWQERHACLYDVHGLVVYQGAGHFGHYIAFVRQEDGAFLCFDDEQVTEHASCDAVKAAIEERGGDGFPATVRMVVYRQRGALGRPEKPAAAEAPSVAADAQASKRRRTQ